MWVVSGMAVVMGRPAMTCGCFYKLQITNRVRGGIGTDFDRKYNIVCVLLRIRTKAYILFYCLSMIRYSKRLMEVVEYSREEAMRLVRRLINAPR